MFTHNCEMEDGTLLRCRILRLDPPFAYGRQAVIEFEDEPGENYRIGCSRLTSLKETS